MNGWNTSRMAATFLPIAGRVKRRIPLPKVTAKESAQDLEPGSK
jgi:hypothetical protein